MTFKEVLAQVIDWLQQDQRISYRALKRQFDLDDAYLDDLKRELIEVRQCAIDRHGSMLVWSGSPAAAPTPGARRGAEAELRFHTLLAAVMWLLQRDRRITYRTLMSSLGLDAAWLAEIRAELLFRQVARDEQGEGLVWTGEAQSASPSAVVDLPPTIALDTHAVTASAPSPEPTHLAPEAERRQLTVMFCDLADSTVLAQQLDPEHLREAIRAYQATAVEVVQRFDGYPAQYLGDGLLIYFGWPQAHEDDAQRAVHTGLGIVEAITTELNPRLEQDKGVQLAVRVGIHTGPVVVGTMGSAGRQEHLATGDTVNIAARLEGLAAPNTVVLSQVTARLVQPAFVLEDFGLHTLKGVAEPMQVFRVLGPMVLHEDEEEITPEGRRFLVGRDEEVGLLLRRWEQSKEGLGQVVLLSGEAGIGKSTPVEKLRTQVREESFPRIAYRCSPYHTTSTLYPVIEQIQRVLQFQQGDTPETKLDKLARVLNGYSRPLEEVVPLYAALLSVPEGRYPPLTLTSQQQRQQTQDALVGWLLEEAERHPVLAVWEDLHWADPSTLELLELVLEQTPTVPMLHVLTFRPGFTPPWPMRSHMTPITLNRLERLQVKALIAHLANGKALPEDVIEHIVTKTDGVPLFAEELTKMLLASDLLQEEADRYVLAGSLTTTAIPATLQDSLMARLDQHNTAKAVAQLGAVIGQEFPYDMLQAIWGQDEETLQTGLAQLL
jgi:class 3 adenylate cyclase